MPKKINKKEHAIITWLLKNASVCENPGRFIPYLESLEIVEQCKCGCPSRDFVVGERAEGAKPIADAIGISPEGVTVGLILWGKDNIITALEVYPWSDADNFSLPIIITLKPNTKGYG
jgi:hypothetical protein